MSNETSARVEGESGAQIFLDCDGVLADFDSYAEKIFGLPPRKAEEKLGAKRFWCDLQSHEGFYRNLPLMPDARELFDAVAHLNPIILTGLPLGGWAEPQKREWGAKHFPHTTMICCMSADKRNHMKPGDILIDDFLKYKSLWVEAGGIFIHHTSTRASLAELKKLGILPEAKPEPKVGESGLSDELSDEQFVKQVHPHVAAEVEYLGFDGDGGDAGWAATLTVQIGFATGPSENSAIRDAWASARAGIEAKPEPLPNTLQEERIELLEDVLRQVKRRIHFIGWPQEAKDELGCPVWVNEINAIENALRGAAPNTLQEVPPRPIPKLVREWDREAWDWKNAGHVFNTTEVIAYVDALEALLAAPKVVDSKEEQEEVSEEDDAYGIPEGRQCVCWGTPGCEVCGGSGDLADAKPKVEEQDGEREPLRHQFSLRDAAIIEVSQLGIGDVEDVTAACDYPDNSDESGCISVCVDVMERALKAEAENKLLKAKSVAPPSLPTPQTISELLNLAALKHGSVFNDGHVKYILANASRAAAPVALPTHQLISIDVAGLYATFPCSCGRTFVASSRARARASFEAHLPKKEGK